MNKHVHFIHGAGEGAYNEDALLAESLQCALGEDYVVRYPCMINEDCPDYFDWTRQISNELRWAEGKVYLVGHSVGGSVLLKYVLENHDKISLAGLFLIATPFWGADEF